MNPDQFIDSVPRLIFGAVFYLLLLGTFAILAQATRWFWRFFSRIWGPFSMPIGTPSTRPLPRS